MAEVQIEAGRSHEVRIHINRQPYESPNPTTGAALYALGSIPGHYELFGEVDGDREDDLIPRNDTKIRLSKDEHFYSQKEFRIIVNARPKDVTERVLSFCPDRGLGFSNASPGAKRDVHDHLQERTEENPRRNPARGRNGQNKGWHDLQCHTD